MQTVFRVQSSQRRTQNREKNQQVGSPVHRPRRAHQKSRRGCKNCKRRRVKCDENVDHGCRNCQRHGINCDYVSFPVGTGVSMVSSTMSMTPTLMLESARSTALTVTRQYRPIEPLCQSPRFISPLECRFQQPDDIAPVHQTMSFFETFTCSTVTTIDGLSVFRDSILALSHHRDYLLHAILGMSAAHLRAMNGVMENQQECQRYSKTESYHWHHAIKQYRLELTNEASMDHVDSLITTSMLLGLYRFQIDGPEDVSFVNTPRSQRQAKLQWLVIPMGFPAVLRHVRQHIEYSVWFKIFNSATPADQGWTIDLETASGIFADFLDLCSIGPGVDDDENPYKYALMDLFALCQIERLTMRDMGQVVSFMSRLNGKFQGLLIALDGKALLILVYWLAILDKLKLWWAKSRAAQEAQAIIEYLELNEDTRIRNLLKIPRMTFAHNLEGPVMADVLPDCFTTQYKDCSS